MDDVVEAETAEAAHAAVADLFALHSATIYRYAARRLGPDAGGDVTAEVFAVALARWPAFDASRGAPLNWLYGIASNVMRRQHRTEMRRLRTLAMAWSRHVDREPDPLALVDQRTDAAVELDAVIQLIERLAPDDRELLILCAWEELGSGEIAEALGMPVGTVKSKISRLRATLRKERVDDSE